ncbi:MAG TPA: ABC transporter substrate-binding protein [Geminicoccaceae bacterium]
MDIKRLTIGMVAAVWMTAGLVSAAQAEPLRVFYFNWVGYGPLFLAQEKGFFAREGVEVELINNEIHAAAFGGLLAGQADAVAGALLDAPAFSEPDEPLVCALVMGESRGADGIVASKDVQSIADLKGRSVAVLRGGLPQFYLNVLLKEAGLSEADIEVVDLTPDDAGQAFLLKEVDAAVTFEPWLTQGKEAAHGHLLADSSEKPGLLVDCLMTTPGVLEKRQAEFNALGRAWEAAVKYVDANPEDAVKIMAERMGGWLEDPAVFAETLKGVRFYDSAQNREYFGTPEKPGQVYQTMQHAIDVWSELGTLKVKLVPADLIVHGIFDE